MPSVPPLTDSILHDHLQAAYAFPALQCERVGVVDMLRIAVLSQCLLFIDGCANNTGNTPAGPLSLSRFSDGEFVLFRLNGDRYPGEAKPEGAELLHGWEIL